MTRLEMHELAVMYYEAKVPFIVQYKTEYGWRDCHGEPLWKRNIEYRRKPDPRVWYLNDYGDDAHAHTTIEKATAGRVLNGTTIRVVEDVDWNGEA